ncbi:type II toxin-antitoxin system VapC family toxin [Compostibacter hankyongensis]|uniref:type II toxin-antitoxin system VapC family toxin n=1 Tax=Compostibacter hankyongensis TaxID=1007089 RepID=UPI0031EA44DA
MTLLLDTHYLIWALTDTKKLSGKIKPLLTDPENRVLVSVVSLWEVSLKSALGKLNIQGFSPEDLPLLCQQIGFDILPLSVTESSTYHQLEASYHKDPFDRMLIWQALSNGYIFVTADKQVRKYCSAGLKLL